MEEVKNNSIEINGNMLSLDDLCQVITESDSIPGLITQRFNFVGSKDSCVEEIRSTYIKPEKGKLRFL